MDCDRVHRDTNDYLTWLLKCLSGLKLSRSWQAADQIQRALHFLWSKRIADRYDHSSSARAPTYDLAWRLWREVCSSCRVNWDYDQIRHHKQLLLATTDSSIALVAVVHDKHIANCGHASTLQYLPPFKSCHRLPDHHEHCLVRCDTYWPAFCKNPGFSAYRSTIIKFRGYGLRISVAHL